MRRFTKTTSMPPTSSTRGPDPTAPLRRFLPVAGLVILVGVVTILVVAFPNVGGARQVTVATLGTIAPVPSLAIPTVEPTARTITTPAPPSASGGAGRSPQLDPEAIISQRLVERLSLQGNAIFCSMSSDLAMAPLDDETLRAIDREVGERGSRRWLTRYPLWWVGPRDSLLEEVGAVWWGPGRRSIWVEHLRQGTWWGSEYKEFVTPAGHSVWTPGNSVHVEPGRCTVDEGE